MKGVCGLCEKNCSCETRSLDGIEVAAYAAPARDEQLFSDAADCHFASSVAPVASSRTDRDGVFQLPLTPGSYLVRATDPETGCDRVNPVAVSAGVAVVGMIFDHGVY